MRVFFAAGGTAGHIYPAIAIAEIIKSKYKDAEFLFAACHDSMEERMLQKEGYQTVYLNIHGLKRSLTLKNVRILAEVPKAIHVAKKYLRAFAPDIVIGTGGYICYPVLRAAKALHIKTALHESNAIPGLTAKLLAKKSDVVMVSMAAAAAQFSQKVNCQHVGTPLRSSFSTTNRFTARKRLGIPTDQFMILSFGGSLGAESLNKCCVNLMGELQSKTISFAWVHATGEKNYEATQSHLLSSAQTIPPSCRIVPYIHNMADYMSASDLIICRSGASTLAEISTLGKPSILIPYPNAAKDHQSMNAQAMEWLGGAYVVYEGEAMETTLKEKLQYLLGNDIVRQTMGRNARKLQGENIPSRILKALKI